MKNLITDVPGVRVGNAEDPRAATGTTVARFDGGAAAGVAIHGGAPGLRDVTLLEPEMMVERIDAVVLSGGSVFGLDAAGGASSVLLAEGCGQPFGNLLLPIVPQAILFDLRNGGTKDWLEQPHLHRPPYWILGRDAAAAAADAFRLGTAGAGFGATTANLKGGLGSASLRLASGATVGALVAVNAIGTATIGDGPHFWAAAFERDAEFGGLGWPTRVDADALALRFKGRAGDSTATTIALVATDATLTKAQCKRLAIMANAGLARALRPVNAPHDGDTVFAAATCRHGGALDHLALTELGSAAADCLARAVARGVYEATALPFADALPSWRARFEMRR
jgi:D-aminopeptidase